MNRLGAVILCGGESRRMGQSKAWLEFGPERMLPRVVRLVGSAAGMGQIAVVAAPGQDLPPLPDRVVIVRDEVPGQGPLRGLSAGFAALEDRAELVYASATDVPLLKPAWIEQLCALLGDHDMAIPRAEGYFHPLAALYRRAAALPAIDGLLAEGRLRPFFLVEALRARVVDADEMRPVDPELRTLRNLNTPEDYREALGAADRP